MCSICGYDEARPRSPMFLPHGVILIDKYRIGRVLGRPGGFGITYLAWDIHLQQRVAIKEYLPRELANRAANTLNVNLHTQHEQEAFEAGREQFLREARIVAQLDHPNIVRVLSFFNANGTAYLVMDYYEGMSVGDYLAAVQPSMEPVVAVGIIEPVLEGLAFVHSQGVVHRDIKPHNLYLAAVGKPILLDFGAARQAAGDAARSLSVVLTEGYAPLEQYQRRTAQGPWTDVYGLAATLFRMVTGQAPPMALDRLGNESLDSPGWAALPADLQGVLTRALAVRPQDRYQSAEAFRSALREWRLKAPPPGSPAPGSAAPSAMASAHDDKAPAEDGDTADRSRRLHPHIMPTPDRTKLAEHAASTARTLPWLMAAVVVAAGLGWAAMTWFPGPGTAERTDPALQRAAPTAPTDMASPPPPAAAASAATDAGTRSTLGPLDLVELPLVQVPAQRVTLGGADDLAATVVSLAAYDITAHEITVEAFAQFVADQAYRNPRWAHYPCDGTPEGGWSAPRVATTERVPVACVNVEDALAFAAWRSAISNERFRLPTEVEWEAAARGGRTTAYWWGDVPEAGRANCAGCRPFTSRSVNVGRYPPNPLGLYDTAGNVREWTCSAADGATVSTTCSEDQLDTLGLRFVLRGGSWHQPAEAMRSGARDALEPLRRDHHSGFRLVRERP